MTFVHALFTQSWVGPLPRQSWRLLPSPCLPLMWPRRASKARIEQCGCHSILRNLWHLTITHLHTLSLPYISSWYEIFKMQASIKATFPSLAGLDDCSKCLPHSRPTPLPWLFVACFQLWRFPCCGISTTWPITKCRAWVTKYECDLGKNTK